jgi:tetraacyldisaccharide 4'-kinase
VVLHDRLVQCWYARWGWCLLLIPVSWLFALLAWWRRGYYGWRPPVRLPVPVIVVGNITVGGTGKTPLVLWMVEQLRAAGYRPGVISRGYGAAGIEAVEVVSDSLATQVGDEPVLIARRGACPVFICRNRRAAGQALLARHPDVDVIISDDGLQHYGLARDMEIVVIDGERGFGNGQRLPAGPLREGTPRLAGVDAIVVNGPALALAVTTPRHTMHLLGGRFYSLAQPERTAPSGYFAGREVHAVAAIGNPARFFEALGRLGIAVRPHAFPDHHPFVAADLPAGTVIMTEKDAVKCAGFGRDNIWVFAVDADLSKGLEAQILNVLEHQHG